MNNNIDISVFQNMSDSDFFSNKLNHIYFNKDVDDESVNELIANIKEAHKDIITSSGAILKPKPILIHISSYGGSLEAGMRLLSIFATSSIPIATIIDNYSCSAATFLSINSHYRLINNYGFCLIHGYTVSINNTKKKEREFKDLFKQYDMYFAKIIEMYLNRTKFKDDELKELLQHDLLLDAKFCFEKGIVDRIITMKKQTKQLNKNIDIREILNINNNTIYISCNNSIKELDKILFEENLAPIILKAKQEICKEDKSGKKSDDDTLVTTFFETLNFIPRILHIKSPIYAIIDGPISIDDLLPMLYCDHIYMFDYAFIIGNILNFYDKTSLLLSDNIKNTELLFNIIDNILKENTKMTKQNIDDIKNKFTIINSKDCKKMGLCNSIINYHQ
jgi:ATP-dependent protease ClpP protease subunit